MIHECMCAYIQSCWKTSYINAKAHELWMVAIEFTIWILQNLLGQGGCQKRYRNPKEQEHGPPAPPWPVRPRTRGLGAKAAKNWTTWRSLKVKVNHQLIATESQVLEGFEIGILIFPGSKVPLCAFVLHNFWQGTAWTGWILTNKKNAFTMSILIHKLFQTLSSWRQQVQCSLETWHSNQVWVRRANWNKLPRGLSKRRNHKSGYVKLENRSIEPMHKPPQKLQNKAQFPFFSV